MALQHPPANITMPKNFYDQNDTKCTKCRQEVYAGGGNQFVDDDGVLQRYCFKCHKKWWQELERKYDAAAAKSKPAEPAEPPVDRPAPVVEQLPPPPPDVVGTQGDGAPPSPADPQGPVLGT